MMIIIIHFLECDFQFQFQRLKEEQMKKKTFYNIKENTDLCHFMLDKVIKIDNYSKSLNMQLFFCFVFLIVQHCRNNMLQYIVLLLIS